MPTMLATMPPRPVVETSRRPDGRILVRATWPNGRRRQLVLEPWAPELQEPDTLRRLLGQPRQYR